MAADNNVNFLSALRRGMTLGITREDFSAPPTDGSDGTHATLAVRLSFDPASVTTDRHESLTNLTLVGPGDIVGLDTRTIVRMFPKPDENDGEDGFLAYVELEQADLPWRYTPAAIPAGTSANADRLRPWLTLLVFEEQTEVADDDIKPPTGGAKLPLLTVKDPTLLPSLDDAWAWAHVQVAGAADEGSVAQKLAGRAGAVVARILSARRLKPTTAYRAFLVPTFMRGVFAGRGTDPGTTDALAPAWPFPTGDPATLPVYHSWRFQTGSVSSFAQAVGQLRPSAQLPGTVGLRAIDVSAPGLGLPNPNPPVTPPTVPPTIPATMPLGGALQTPDQSLLADPAVTDGWTTALASFIDLGTQSVNGQTLRVVAPPLYGRWCAAEAHLDHQSTNPKTNPPWFSLLNRDPRYRVAAALGTQVVQADQQALMASAWDQGARLEIINRTRRVMQAGREVFIRIVNRHLNTTPTSTVFTVTSLVCGRVLSCTGGPGPKPTLSAILRGSPFGGCLHPPWRRVFKGDGTIIIDTINGGGLVPDPGDPGGIATTDPVLCDLPAGLPDPEVGTVISSMTADQRLYWGVVIFWVARKLLVSQGGRFWWLLRKLLHLGLDLIALGSTQGVPTVTMAQKICDETLTSIDVLHLPPVNVFTAATADPDPTDPTTWPALPAQHSGPDSVEAAAFKSALEALLDYVRAAPAPAPVLNKVDIPGLVQCVLTALAPATTFVAAEQARHVVTRPISWQAQDPLEPMLLPPKVGKPMWEALRDVSPEWILPGVGDVPRNSVSLLKTNQKFIEAFMVGLNHEMTRELLWNGYPTDQRGTYFDQFWDSRGWVKGSANDADRTEDLFADIVPIAGWTKNTSLGDPTHTGRQPPTDHLVLLVRGDVIKRYSNVFVYAVKATQAQPGGPVTLDDTQQKHPVFQAVLTGDVAFYGFELDQAHARGDATDPGWFFVLQEHPSEPKFNREPATGDATNATPADYSSTDSADVAATAYETPLRVAFRGKDLLPT